MGELRNGMDMILITAVLQMGREEILSVVNSKLVVYKSLSELPEGLAICPIYKRHNLIMYPFKNRSGVIETYFKKDVYLYIKSRMVNTLVDNLSSFSKELESHVSNSSKSSSGHNSKSNLESGNDPESDIGVLDFQYTEIPPKVENWIINYN